MKKLKACPVCGSDEVGQLSAMTTCDNCDLMCRNEYWDKAPRRTDPCPKCADLKAKGDALAALINSLEIELEELDSWQGGIPCESSVYTIDDDTFACMQSTVHHALRLISNWKEGR